MLSSISPVGEAARRQRWTVTVTAYLVGSAMGGLVVGALAGGLGQLVLGRLGDQAALVALGALAAAGVAADVAGRVPSWRRQVDERWLGQYRGWVYGFGFGVQLGTGVVTIVPASIVYVALAAAALTGSVESGALIGLVFGAGRAVPLVSAATTRTAVALRARLAAVELARRPAALATRVGQVAVATAALAAALGA